MGRSDCRTALALERAASGGGWPVGWLVAGRLEQEFEQVIESGHAAATPARRTQVPADGPGQQLHDLRLIPVDLLGQASDLIGEAGHLRVQVP